MKPVLRRAAFVALATLAAGACSASPDNDPAATATPTGSAGTPATSAQSSAPAADPRLDSELFKSATANDAARVRELLRQGARIESRGAGGCTPLVAATKQRAAQAALVLIEAGANVNAKDDMQDSAYLYAGAEGLNDILAATLRHGANVRSVNRYGGTALIPASEHGHVQTVRMLIAAGVNVNHVNTPKWTALQEAVVYGDGSQRYVETVRALLAAGADPNIADAQGRTALQNAERRNQDAIVALLRNR